MRTIERRAAVSRERRARPGVLMVTGAYYPELSGGGLQARAVVRALRDAATFTVITTSIDPSLPSHSHEDEVPIRRITVDIRRSSSELIAAVRMIAAFLRSAPRFEIVNLHGFSRKAILLLALSRLSRKRFVLTLQTGIHDEPDTARAMGRLAYWAYSNADLYLSVSPGLSRAYLAAGLPAGRLRQVCNAVDVERFKPVGADERRSLRAQLGLPLDCALVLFVGYFSRDKRPDLLYEAWARTDVRCPPSAIVFVGATRESYREVDPTLAEDIRARAKQAGIGDRVFFVEVTHEIEKYYQAVDLYVLPSVREGLPIALLEAMASRLPCVATRLAGSTEGLIEDGINGLLVEPDDVRVFSLSIHAMVADTGRAAALGAAARETVIERYAIQRTAPVWLSAYRELASLHGADAVRDLE